MVRSRRDRRAAGERVAAPAAPAPPARAGTSGALAALLVAAVGCTAFANAFDGVYLYDDEVDLLANPHVRSLWPPWDAMGAPAQSGLAGRPLAALSFAVDHALFGYDAGLWHAASLAVHLVCALLLYAVVRRALLAPPLAPRFGELSTPIALVTALLWVAHPLQTAAVTYVVHRIEALASAWILAVLYCAQRSFRSPRPGRWQAAGVACAFAAAATKEIAVAAPLLVLLYDRTLEAGSFRRALRLRKGFYGGLAASWALVAALVASAEGRSASVGFGLGGVGPWEYLKVQAWAIPRYLRLALWPDDLVLDYGRPLREGALQWLPHGLAVLALLLATAVAIARRSALGLAGAAFFLILAPTSSVLPVVTEMVAEHRMYLPLAALLVVAVAGAARLLVLLPSAAARRALGAGAAMALLVPLALATRARNRDYQSETGMWADVVSKRPDNARAQACYGNGLREAGDMEGAIQRYREAVRLEPENPYWRSNLGSAFLDTGRIEEAVAELREAVRLEGEVAWMRANLGQALALGGEGAAAARELEEALRLDPDCAPAHRVLGTLAGSQGRPAAAAQHLGAALRSQPDDPRVTAELAWLLVTAPAVRDGPRALELALRARHLAGGDEPATLDLLAAALAECGRFDEAARTAAAAADIAEQRGHPAVARRLRQRAAVYRSGGTLAGGRQAGR